MDAADVRAKAFAMPLSSPSFPRGPYRYADREHLIITYRTDRETLDQATPEPLDLDEALARCEFMRMESSTGFGCYSGAAQHIPVKLGGEQGAYTHDMFLDAHAPRTSRSILARSFTTISPPEPYQRRRNSWAAFTTRSSSLPEPAL